MNAKTIKPRAHRTIKIEVAGDMFHRNTYPKIRLQGKWLEELGFRQDGRVELIPLAPGVMTLKVVEEPPVYSLNEMPVHYGKKK